MNWKNFFELWETYCKKALRERYKAEEKGKHLYHSHSGFYEPYFGEPHKCSAVCIFNGRQLDISYLKWMLQTFPSYWANMDNDPYWTPANKENDINLLDSRRLWAKELNQVINGEDETYNKKPFFVSYTALYDYYYLDPKTEDKFSERDFLDYLLSASDKADLRRVILCTNADLKGFFRRLGYKPIFQVVNGVEKQGKFTLSNWPNSENSGFSKKYNGPVCRTYIGYLIDPGDGTKPYKVLLSYAKIPRHAPSSRFREVEAELITKHFHK